MTTFQKPEYRQLDDFTRGYLLAAFFTNDEEAPGGCDYRDTGRAPFLYSHLDAASVEQAIAECQAYQKENATLLERAGNPEQNGMDFWFSRCGHGVGYWDRGYGDLVGESLSEAAKKCGERYFMAEGDKIYIE